jgi:hypothetical protein
MTFLQNDNWIQEEFLSKNNCIRISILLLTKETQVGIKLSIINLQPEKENLQRI